MTGNALSLKSSATSSENWGVLPWDRVGAPHAFPRSARILPYNAAHTEATGLAEIAAELRLTVMKTIIGADYGHPASALGLADFFAAMYFRIMHHDPKTPAWEGRDRLVVSCGHISAIIYAALARAGYFSEALLTNYANTGSPLHGHPVRDALPGVEATTGSLGQGVSIAVGMALAARAKGETHTTYLLMSDGEQQEGQVWEAMLAVNKYQLNKLIMFVDCNGIQNSNRTDDVMPLGNLAQKYQAFGLNVLEIDGNDASQILAAEKVAKVNARPTVIVMHTTPGKGVDFMENDAAWHGDAPNMEQGIEALRQLEI